jgi:hypothetical protein
VQCFIYLFHASTLLIAHRYSGCTWSFLFSDPAPFACLVAAYLNRTLREYTYIMTYPTFPAIFLH